MRYIPDTNIWIYLLRKQENIRQALERALREDDTQIVVPPVVYFELLRGLEKRKDSESITFFKKMLDQKQCRYMECTRAIWDLAIQLWVKACTENKARQDADILIAAFAKDLNALLVTENTKDFSHLGIELTSWAS